MDGFGPTLYIVLFIVAVTCIVCWCFYKCYKQHCHMAPPVDADHSSWLAQLRADARQTGQTAGNTGWFARRLASSRRRRDGTADSRGRAAAPLRPSAPEEQRGDDLPPSYAEVVGQGAGQQDAQPPSFQQVTGGDGAG